MSSDFRATTQYQRWTFSKAALSFRRKVAFDETEKRIAAKIEEASNDAKGAGQPPAKRLKKDDEAASASEADLSLMIPPVVIDGAAHLRLVHLASRKVLQLCREAKFDRAIMATALIFLRRFFINCTALEHDPEAIITAATFLAIKVEACPYLEVPGFLQRLGLTSEYCNRHQRRRIHRTYCFIIDVLFVISVLCNSQEASATRPWCLARSLCWWACSTTSPSTTRTAR